VSYNICERCGKPWGMVNMTIYECLCQRNHAFATRLWRAWFLAGMPR